MSDESLPEIPDSWKLVNLIDISFVISGKTPKGISSSENGTIPFFKVKDMNTVGNEKFMFKSDIYFTDEDVKKFKLNIQKEGTVIFPKRGGAISTNKKRILSEPSAYDLNIMGVNSVLVPYTYIYYWISSIELISLADGSNVPQINHKDIEPLLIPLPPLDEQKRIVNKVEELFTKLDAGIQELTRAKEKLKVYRQSVLKHAFEGKLTEEWREAHKDEIENASIILKRIEKDLKEKLGKKYKSFPPSNVEELPILPDEWEWASFSQIGDLISGQHIKTQNYNQDSNGMPYLTGPADFGFKYPLISKWTPKPKAKALKDDVMITVKGAGIGKVNVLDIEEAAISRQLMSIRASDFDQNFIYYYIKSNFYYFQKLGSSSTVPGINRDQILKSVIPVPPLDEQKEIGNEISKIFSLIENMESNIDHGITQANRLRQSILKKAFTGKLVPQDPNDEPAEQLLERIKAQKEKQKPQRKSKQKRLVK